MDVMQTRIALAEALSVHDVDAVRTFLHPDFVVQDEHGEVALDHSEFLQQLTLFFDRNPEYRQSVQFESVEAVAGIASLISRRVEVLRTLWRSHSIQSRWGETWQKIACNWLLLTEKPLPT